MSDGYVIRVVRMVFALLGRVSPPLAGHLAARLMFIPRPFPRPQRETDWIDRATCLDLQCGLAAWSWGNREHPIVLLVHGWSGRGTQLCAFIEPLLRAGRCVVAIDGDGHGDSPGWRTDPFRFAAAISKVGAELGPLEAIIAHSFGAATSTMAISNGMVVQRMVYMAGPAVYENVLRRAAVTMNLPARAYPNFVNCVEKKLNMSIAQMDMRRITRRMNIPALVIHSRDDDEVDYAEGERIAETWPDAELVSFEDLGHMRIMWDDDSVAATVRFITRPDSPGRSSDRPACTVSGNADRGAEN